MIPGPVGADTSRALVDVARGRAPADLVVRGGRIVNVYSEEIVAADVAVAAGRIAYVGSQLDAVGPDTEVIEADGAYVLPGYMEPHCHPWALYNPDTMARAVLPWGNTAMVGELLNFQLVLSPDEMSRVYAALQEAPVRWYWAIRGTGQSHQPLEGPFSLEVVSRLMDVPGAVQLAEITSWPQVLAGDTDLLERMALAKEKGLKVDGHSAGATPEKITALAAAGFTADHESINVDEALAKLRNGYHVILRNSSLRPDLDALLPLVTEGRGASRMSVTSDGSGPAWLADQGLIDGIVRRLVGAGVPIPRAVALATLNPATYFGLDEHLGGLAPGRCADLQVLRSFEGEPPDAVFVAGRLVADRGRLVAPWPLWDGGPMAGRRPRPDLDVVGDPGSYRVPAQEGETVPVMQFVSAGIARAGQATIGPDGWAQGCLLAVLFSEDGRRRSWAWVRGFAPGLDALATTYTTSSDYLVIGGSPDAMAVAARRAFAGQGGIAVVEGRSVTASLDLDLGGMMSTLPMADVLEGWRAVDGAVRKAGYAFEELLFCLCFMTCDFLPDLRLVADGLLEVKTGRVLVAAEHFDSRG